VDRSALKKAAPKIEIKKPPSVIDGIKGIVPFVTYSVKGMSPNNCGVVVITCSGFNVSKLKSASERPVEEVRNNVMF
jgi:hypothetical protein